MTTSTDTVLNAAMQAYTRDELFRRHVDQAVAASLDHFKHIDSEVDQRDLAHAATLAATTVLRLAIDGDSLLKSMEFQRDAAEKMALRAAHDFPGTLHLRVEKNPSNETP